MTSVRDFSNRAPRALRDGEEFSTGRFRFRWFCTPHVPHSWECGLLMETITRTFFCGDLFTEGGKSERALTSEDILGPSEACRQPLDYFAHAPQTASTLERLAQENPVLLARMHGSAWHGDGRALLLALRDSLATAA